VPDRLVAVEKKVKTLLSQNGDHSKNKATGDALAKTQKDVEALQNQIKKCLAIIDSQSQKVHDLEEENKAIRADFRDFQAEVKSNINNKLAAAMVSLDSTIKSTETDIRREILSKIREVEKGLGESTNTLKAQIEKQKDRLSEQIPRIDELGQVADQVVSKVASLFKRKSDEDPEGRNENKRQRT
jgi:F0F1-type ATP synthase membrane subunit b/b'